MLPPQRDDAADPPAEPENSKGSDELEDLTVLAIQNAKDILELHLDRNDEEFANILRSKQSVLQTVLNTQTRVDEGRFRKREVDTLGKLLDMMAEQERQMKTLN